MFVLMFVFCLCRNIVSTVNLGCKLDLKKIALHARNAEYNPKVCLFCSLTGLCMHRHVHVYMYMYMYVYMVYLCVCVCVYNYSIFPHSDLPL